MERNSQFAKENSIVLQGPIGVGKSTIAEELAKRTKLPHVWADTLRECPKDCEQIEQKIKDFEREIERLEKDSSSQSIKDTIVMYKHMLWLQKNYLSQRQLLPDLPNYADFGFSPEISSCLKDCYGPIAWHMYHKQFENLLLQELTEQVDFPCIIDLGGGMASSPKAAYDKTVKEILASDNHYFSEWRMDSIFNFKKMDFSIIENSLKPFKNVVTFKQKVRNANGRGEGAEKLNKAFLSSGDFDKTATMSVDATGLFGNDLSLNNKKVDEIVSNILLARSENMAVEMAR